MTLLSSVVTIGGCPLDVQLDQRAALTPGLYWVESGPDGISAIALPRKRGEDSWLASITFPATNWYEEPGVYQFSADAGWQRHADEAESLDEVLQLLDVAPDVGE